MTPTRLPRPGQVQELCRLCAAELVLSLDNPRRVCAKCGEVNLPSDHGVDSPRVSSAARPRPAMNAEVVYFGLGAATPVVWMLARVLMAVIGAPGGHTGLRGGVIDLIVLPTLLVASIVIGRRADRLRLRTGGFWALGFVLGLAASYALFMLGLFLFLGLFWR